MRVARFELRMFWMNHVSCQKRYWLTIVNNHHIINTNDVIYSKWSCEYSGGNDFCNQWCHSQERTMQCGPWNSALKLVWRLVRYHEFCIMLFCSGRIETLGLWLCEDKLFHRPIWSGVFQIFSLFPCVFWMIKQLKPPARWTRFTSTCWWIPYRISTQFSSKFGRLYPH